jgi:hypothetical protein
MRNARRINEERQQRAYQLYEVAEQARASAHRQSIPWRHKWMGCGTVSIGRRPAVGSLTVTEVSKRGRARMVRFNGAYFAKDIILV